MSKKTPNKNNLPLKKILLVGIQNSGKSSLVLSLKGKTSLPEYSALRPTKGASQTNFTSDVLDSEFNIWDLGGQDLYRNEYLANFQKYAAGANKMIYVIDVQDTKNYDLALDYFEKIIKLLKTYEDSISISVFLHKADPDYKLEEDRVLDLIQKIRARLPEALNPKVEIFKTTIHTVFEKKIVD